MKNKMFMVTMGIVCLVALSVAADGISLAGVWRVAGDGFVGEANLPGTLAAAHLGKRWTERDFQTTMDLPQSEALVQEWQYVGKATWTRTVTLTAEDCRHAQELFLERVMWASEAFWDGASLGVCDSLATPHVHAVPRDLLTPGRHELRLVIDNGCRYNFSRQSHAYGPNMQAVWNGVLGRIELRRAHPLRNVRVFASAPSGGRLTLETAADVAAVEVEGLKTSGWAAKDGRIVVTLAEEPVWWNEFHPALYTVRLTAKDGFTHSVRFGFRTVGTDGRLLTLNGVRTFTRGNVENANFARDGVPWMEKGEWLRVFRALRDEDGVNAVRFHTWCPPEAAFAAADELGIVLHPEAGIWTDGWMSDGDEVGNGKPVDGFVRREMKAIADAYGNAPSFFSLSIGNELGNSNFETMGRWVEEHKRYDPRALCYASSARKITPADDFSLSHVVPGKGLARERLLPHTDWDYEDVYSAAKVPTVAHEIGQWPVYPIWDELLSPFTGTMRPWNLTRHRDTAAKKGMLRFQREFHAASAKLNRIIYKEEVESFLRTPSCAGLQLLEVQDYTGQAEALVGWRDPFYALKSGFKGMPPFSKVWGPICFLARFPRFTYVAGETYRATLQIRNLTEKSLTAGTKFPYELGGKRGEIVLAEAITSGEVKTVGTVECLLSDDMAKSRQTLRFGGNSWNFWVYPREGRCPAPGSVVETGDIAAMKAALAEGRTVLYSGPSFKSAKGQFKSVYWSARWFQVPNTTAAALGTWFDVKHPALAGFVTDDFTDWQWHSLAQGATIHALKDMPAAFRPVALSVNDFHFSDFTATMFEVLVGKGRLFVCGYDLTKDTSEAKRLRASICAYLSGAPATGTVRMPESWLADEFDAVKAPDLSGAVYDVTTNWTGRTFRMDIRDVPPTTGNLRIDFHQPTPGLTSARGLLEGRMFEVPFTHSKDAKTHVSLPVIREDFLDGRLQLEVNLMTGSAIAIDRIRIIPESECEGSSATACDDEGWRNVCASRRLPKPVRGIWRAPLEKGADAFAVEWRGGATGTVAFVSTPQGPGVEIAKRTPGGYVVVTIRTPFPVPPGSKLRAYAGCESSDADCGYSYGFLRLYGAKENLAHFSGLTSYGSGGPKQSRIANTPPGMPDRKLCHFLADADTGTNVTAAIVVAGAPSTSLWTGWGVEDFDAANKAWWDAVRNRRPPKGAQTEPSVKDAEFDATLAAEPDHTAKVVRMDGLARLLIDGQPVLPVFFKGSSGFYGGAKMAASGMDLQSVDIRLGVTKKGQATGYWSKDGFDVKGAVTAIRHAMMLAPKAKYLLGIDLSAYPEFSDEHPDEVWLNDQDRKVFGHNCHSHFSLPKQMDPKRHWYWISNHSLVWRDAVKDRLTELICELKRTGLSRLIVGVHLAGYHDAQFATVHPDYSKPAIAGFRRWLRTKYPDVAALRSAWRDPSVTFDAATPPKPSGDHSRHNYLIPGDDQPMIDFLAYIKKAPFFMQEDFARHVKRCFGKDVVTVRYCMSAFGGTYNSAYDITPFVRSDAVDILCAQPDYGRRVPSMPTAIRLPTESFHWHGKLFFNEFDLRTYGAFTVWESENATMSYSRALDDPMWCSINHKLAGMMYARRMGWWYCDMAGGWFEPDGIAADIAETLAAGRALAARRPSAWRPDVAFVTDEDGALLRNTIRHYYNPDEQCLMGEQLQTLAAAGVPYDTWLLDDWLEEPSLARRYRTIVFWGMYDIDARRAALLDSLRKDGRTLVFLAGTGVARGVERIGFKLGEKPFPAQHETVAEPGVPWNMNSLLHAAKIVDILGVTRGWPWQYASPTRLFLEPVPDMKAMARFTEDGTVAVAEREDAGARLVYVASYGGLTPEYLHHLAQTSGAYVPTDGHGLEVDMNGDFISLHALKAGRYTFRLPFKATATNLKTGARHSARTSLELTMTAGETRWYGIAQAN